jgi:hypothetical protein
MPVLLSEVHREPARRFGRLYLPRGTLLTAWEFLRGNGHHGCEQICFLAGRVVEDEEGPAAQVTCCVLPRTHATAGYVTLTSHAQTALILDALEERRERPLATLHTHGDAGHAEGPEHSTIDDRGVALTPEDGLFSGIVPYYALGSPHDFVRVTSFYERWEGRWLSLGLQEKRRRLVVHDDVVRIVSAAPEIEDAPQPAGAEGAGA